MCTLAPPRGHRPLRRAGLAPPRGGIRPGPGQTEPSLSLRLWVSYGPVARTHVRLLGPCFKTGRTGCRQKSRRPCAARGRSRGAHARSRGALRTVPPGRQTSGPEAPARGGQATSVRRSGPRPPGYKPSRGRAPSRRASGRPRTGRGSPPEKCAPEDQPAPRPALRSGARRVQRHGG